jgi:hypothetical protein
MPERRFDTGYWNDPDIVDFPMKAKLLYLYLWTNRHCNQAGLYEISLKTISFETDLEIGEIPDLLKILEKKVTWIPEQSLIWAKNFLHHQSKSPQFLAAAAKCLENVNNNGLVKDFIAYNAKYNLLIPYREGMNRVAVPPYSSSLSLSSSHSSSLSSGEKGVAKGEESLPAEDREIVSVWKSVAGFDMELPAMMELLAKLRTDFPDVDVLTESRKWAARKISEPLAATSRPSNQIYNFMAKRHEWNQQRRVGRERVSTDPEKYTKGPLGQLVKQRMDEAIREDREKRRAAGDDGE